MGRRKIDRKFYQLLTEVFRENPGNASIVAKEAVQDKRSGGTCDRRTALKAWEHGWPSFGFKPIRKLIELEEIAARQLLEQERYEIGDRSRTEGTNNEAIAREQARKDAIFSRATEAKLVRNASQNIIQLLDVTKKLLDGYTELAGCTSFFLGRAEIDNIYDVRVINNILWRIAITTKAATDAGMTVLKMERLLLGEPVEILDPKNTEEISDEEAIKELEEAAKAAKRIRERQKHPVAIRGFLSGNKASVEILLKNEKPICV